MAIRRRHDDPSGTPLPERTKSWEIPVLTLMLSMTVTLVSAAVTYGHSDQIVTELTNAHIPDHLSRIDAQIVETTANAKAEADMRKMDEVLIQQIQKDRHDDAKDILDRLTEIQKELNSKADKR